VTVESASQIAGPYELAIGELVIDLRSVDFSGEWVELDASVGIGSLRVLVPEDVEVELTAQVGIGDVQAFGSSRSGFAREIDTFRAGEAGRLVLDAETFIGEVRVSTQGATTTSTSTDFVQRITTPAQLDDSYEFEVGDVRLDLSELVLRTPRTVRISSGTGRIEVIVPSRETTTVYARSDIGRVAVFGQEDDGFDNSVEVPATGQALLTLDIELDAGEIIVEER
ncbi:MAG: LiaF-related protein, partial [Acidimicrobiia bacterium]|nr:LiaF-related protein [Acidimicrobiia bacterium]